MAGDEHDALPQTAKRQVTDIVPVLPFEDEPATFVLVLQELGDAYVLDGEE